MKNRRTLTDARNTIASRPRKWRRPVPCPICGGKDIGFHTFGKGLDRITLQIVQYWNVTCLECRRSAVILTKHTDRKEAIRVWNYLATDYPKAKENTK